MKKSVTKIMKATIAVAMAIGASVGAVTSNKMATRLTADGVTYSLVKDVGDLTSGDSIIIGNGTSGTVKFLSTTQNSNNRGATSGSTVTNESVTKPDDAEMLTLGTSDGKWTIYANGASAGYLYAASSSNNYLRTRAADSDGNSRWTISITAAGVASITAQGSNTRNQLKNNGSLFACYSSGQTSVSIYKLSTDASKTIQANSITIKSGGSTISGTYEPSEGYKVGDTLNLTSSIVNYEQGDTFQDGLGVINWSSSNTSVATVANGVVTFVTAGTSTITGTANDKGAGNVDVTASFILDIDNVLGGQNNPYSVAQARAAIDGNNAAAKSGVYATGIVSQIVTAYNESSGQISYNISSDGFTTSDQLQAYRGKSYNGDNFTSADDIKVGAVVTVHGNLTKYSSTYEFSSNNQLVSYTYVSRYDITFDSKLGSSVPTQKIVEGEKVQVPENPTREPDNDYIYSFDCWCSDPECTQAYDFNASVTSSFTLYAKWNATPVPAKTVIRRDLETKSSLTYHYSKDGNATKDTINNDLAGLSGNNYTAWPDEIEGTSGASYDGVSAASYNSIQLKSDNTKHIGIVTKVSGGIVSKVRVAWNSNTANGRTINIYGKNTAYSSTEDLYSDDTKGTLIGSISCGANTFLNINDEYAYIGIHATGSLYLDSIEISWGSESFEYSNVSIRFSSLISTSLWNRLNTESNIQGYGVMLSTPETLGSDPIEDWYGIADGETIDEKIAYLTTGGNVKNFYMPLTTKTPDQANTAQKAGAEGDHYIWYLNKVVLDNEEGLTAQQIKEKLTQRYVAVGYVRIADEIVFLDEITASAAGLAGAAITGGQGNASTANGSLLNLADMLE